MEETIKFALQNKYIEGYNDAREQIAKELEHASFNATISNEFNFNDTAVRAKTFLLAAKIARGVK